MSRYTHLSGRLGFLAGRKAQELHSGVLRGVPAEILSAKASLGNAERWKAWKTIEPFPTLSTVLGNHFGIPTLPTLRRLNLEKVDTTSPATGVIVGEVHGLPITLLKWTWSAFPIPIG